MLNSDHGDFVRSIERMNPMYRVQVSPIPTQVRNSTSRGDEDRHGEQHEQEELLTEREIEVKQWRRSIHAALASAYEPFVALKNTPIEPGRLGRVRSGCLAQLSGPPGSVRS